jgi:HAD superfamily hydrolase (TIGR01509 family)
MNVDVARKTFSERRHLFFDLDGTLVDSRPAIVNAYHHVFNSVLGKPFTARSQTDLETLLAMRPLEVFSQATSDSIDNCLVAYSDFYIANCSREVQLYEGAKTLLDRLRVLEKTVGIVTNKGQQRAELDLRNTGLIDIASLTVLIGAEHTVERKPHPAPLLAALDRSGASAAESIYIGDGPHDMEAAVQAGMACIGASYGYYPAHALRSAGADALIERPLDLLKLIERVN